MKIVFVGTAEFATSFLQALHVSAHEVCAVYTQPDRKAGRGLQLRRSSVKQLAERYNLPVLQPDSFRSEATVHELQSFHADIIVDVAYGLLLPKSVLSAFPYGCINVHPSLLPRWRGAAPIERAILDGDDETGITIMQVDEGWDTGDILRQQEIKITQTDTAGDLYRKLTVVGEPLLLDTLNDIAQQRIVAVKQNNDLSCYAKKIKKEEAKIVWNKSAIELDRKIRAFNPKPIAYTYCAEQLVRIWRAAAITCGNLMPPGVIVASNKNGVDVATGDGILRLLELQLSGGKVLQVAQLLNSKRELFAVGREFDG